MARPDKLDGINGRPRLCTCIDVSAMEEDEPDATEDDAEEEAADQVKEETITTRQKSSC